MIDQLDQGRCEHEGGGGEPWVCVECEDHCGGNTCPECGLPLCRRCEKELQALFDAQLEERQLDRGAP